MRRKLKGFVQSPMGVWAASSVTLGAAETTFLASKTTPFITGMQRLGFVGGVGLTWAAARDMRRSKSLSDKLDASGDLAWGIEGMLEFSPVLSGATGKLAPLVGTVGGFCQTGVGLRRMWKGWRQRDWGKFKLGVLDTASGGMWLAWDLFGVENPVTVCGFVGLMIGREVYANRKALGAWGKRTACTIGAGFRRGVGRVQAGARRFGQGVSRLGHSMLGRMGRGLEARRPLEQELGQEPVARPRPPN